MVDMEPDVEIDVGEEAFLGGKTIEVIHILLSYGPARDSLPEQVESSPSILASLGNMDQSVPSLQVHTQHCLKGGVDLKFQETDDQFIYKVFHILSC